MNIKATVISVAALHVAFAAHASCGGKNNVLFTCLTEKGKQIEVCNFGKTVRYSYGKPNVRPEFVVMAPREKVTGTSWSGIGRYITNAVAIPNGNTTYQVSWSADKLQESDQLEGGVEVLSGDKSTFISCRSEPSIGNTEGIQFEQQARQ